MTTATAFHWTMESRASAVSYTHLDVYKRQAMNCEAYSRRDMGFSAVCVGYMPVSYTHLDVYKRQM